jgi:hypothetical protein
MEGATVDDMADRVPDDFRPIIRVQSKVPKGNFSTKPQGFRRMSTNTERQESMIGEVVKALRARGEEFAKMEEGLLREVIREGVAESVLTEAAVPSAEFVEQMAARVRFRAKISDEERRIRAKLAARLGTKLDDLDAVVHRQFEGATRDIAERYAQAVRQERARRVTESVLQGLAGKDNASLRDLLAGAADAVADAVVRVQGEIPWERVEQRLREHAGKPLTDSDIEGLLRLARQRAPVPLASGDVAQVAQAVSQAVQQVSLNVQKIIAVALENERASDAEHPRYYDP